MYKIKKIILVIDNKTLAAYEKYYFLKHPKATKNPIKNPYHESINTWMIMKRPIMNHLKRQWKDFIVWFIENQGYTNLHIEKCDMKFITYYKTARKHDIDNSCPKFILDGLSESGLIVDDDSSHITSLTMECYVDKSNPRTEIEILASK
ncbi:RusA family crossover junction endodeoxyribonuclease [Clostridium transplantifaecale]|uniref:RusA family crossover junction endodeoxyribonuclease n=1 Tax=Clostridium transplantifaecale TaxID=2479838 RepID=UPI000F643414|nr:RusA family crossover junction endodeoxyribonuclease [Clostridium transplantifaecale]